MLSQFHHDLKLAELPSISTAPGIENLYKNKKKHLTGMNEIVYMD